MHYIVKFANDMYLPYTRFRGDSRKYTAFSHEAHKYMHYDHIQEIINSFEEKYRTKFKGAKIIDIRTGEIVKHIQIFFNKIENYDIIKETGKAIQINYKNKAYWIAKSQCEIISNILYVSDFLWKQINENEEE